MMHRTVPLVVAIIFALAVLGPYLDGVHIDDHSTEVQQAQDIEDAQRAAEARRRFEQGAQHLCGPQSSWREISNGVIECKARRGLPSTTLTFKE